MARIQNLADIDEGLENLQYFENRVGCFCERYREVIKAFNNLEIIKSFFASGPYGQEQEQKLNNLKNATWRYYTIINGEADSLIQMTRKALNSQRDLLTSSSISSVNNNNIQNLSSNNKFVGRMEEL